MIIRKIYKYFIFLADMETVTIPETEYVRLKRMAEVDMELVQKIQNIAE
jgi:hypothetical protein